MQFNLAEAVIEIIDKYIEVKQRSFKSFIQTCQYIMTHESLNTEEAMNFILNLLAPNVDARIFEIVSYSILKFYYLQRSDWI